MTGARNGNFRNDTSTEEMLVLEIASTIAFPSLLFRRFCPGVPEGYQEDHVAHAFRPASSCADPQITCIESSEITGDSCIVYMKAGTVQTPQIAAKQLCSPAFQSSCHARFALKKSNQVSKRTQRLTTMVIAEVAERPAIAQRPDVDGRFGRFGGKYVRSRYLQLFVTQFHPYDRAHSWERFLMWFPRLSQSAG